MNDHSDWDKDHGLKILNELFIWRKLDLVDWKIPWTVLEYAAAN